MKVALYVAELDIKGGTHKQVLRLAQHLIRQGHHVEVLTPTYVAKATYADFRDIPVTAADCRQERSDGFVGRIARFLTPIKLAFRMKPAEVLHVHDNRCFLFFATAWLLGRARCRVWQINDLHPAFRIGASSEVSLPAWKRRLHVFSNRWMAGRMDAVTVNVGKNRERVRSHFGIDAHLFHCGTDLPADLPQPKASDDGPLQVLSAGAFMPYRNYETLIDGCAIARRTLCKALELTIIGDTRYHPDYVEAVRLRATGAQITLQLRENLVQTEFDAEMERSDVFAFVNIDQSWGLAVFEAAARGRPIVLSESVGASELLAGHPGFEIVDPRSATAIAQALVMLLQDSANCARLGLEAQRYTRTMSWARMYCAPVEALFRQLLSDHRRVDPTDTRRAA